LAMHCTRLEGSVRIRRNGNHTISDVPVELKHCIHLKVRTLGELLTNLYHRSLYSFSTTLTTASRYGGPPSVCTTIDTEDIRFNSTDTYLEVLVAATRPRQLQRWTV